MFEWFVEIFQNFIAFVLSVFESLGLYAQSNEEAVQLVPPVMPMPVEPVAISTDGASF